jgi:hypothetical protein
VTGEEALERRLRALLRVYPRTHRDAHGEEMIGVLLAGTPDGRRPPRLADMVDLLWGGIQIRVQRLLASEIQPWRDALAVGAVFLPLLAMTGQIAQFCDMNLAAAGIGLVGILLPLLGALGWAVVCVLAFTGRTRPAGRLAGFLTIYAVGIPVYDVVHFLGGLTDPYALTYLVYQIQPLRILPGLAAAIALCFSTGPRRGLKILGRRASVLLLVMAGLAVATSPLTIFFFSYPPTLTSFCILDSYLLIWSLAAVLVAFGQRHTRVGRRVVVLATLPLSLTAAEATLRLAPLSSSYQLVIVGGWVPSLLAFIALGSAVSMGESAHRHYLSRSTTEPQPTTHK